ncbi:GNAT family N-acetyltransferase [Lachnobacterium bovis]|uniref:Protein N-acetyltransferase, RimJ/RimL family n=1 Tax=Lachnobacterium bovis TaxID=140626 RepID=A0A1H9TJB6_9FIRM|nr:GNAT family N-acetyltransferase [Lachnobacterium bovis]SER97315.1 Protein N-acetyltransferase, RimJ/RimL family [Lachnobacterium bovis]
MERKLKKIILFSKEQPDEENFIRLRDIELKKHNMEVLEINKDTYNNIELNKIIKDINSQKDALAFVTKAETLAVCQENEIPCIACETCMCADENLFSADVFYSDFTGVVFEDIEDVYKRFYGIPIEIFETKRCIVKEMDLDRFDEFYEMYQQPSFCDYIEPLFDREEELEYQKTYIKTVYPFYGYGMWIVIDKDTDKLIGRVGIEYKDRGKEHNIEIGYAIHPDFQRKGIATEVCMKLFEVAKEEFGIKELVCYVDLENEPSISFAKSLGFKYEKDIEDKSVVLKKYIKFL